MKIKLTRAQRWAMVNLWRGWALRYEIKGGAHYINKDWQAKTSFSVVLALINRHLVKRAPDLRNHYILSAAGREYCLADKWIKERINIKNG